MEACWACPKEGISVMGCGRSPDGWNQLRYARSVPAAPPGSMWWVKAYRRPSRPASSALAVLEPRIQRTHNPGLLGGVALTLVSLADRATPAWYDLFALVA